MNDPRDSAEELSEVVEDLRRHLLWQEEAGGRELLVDAAKQAAERSASLRAIVTPRSTKPPAAPGRAASPEPAAPAEAPTTPSAAVPARARALEAPPSPAAAPRTPPTAPAPQLAPAASKGMLLDVPQQAPPYSGVLPGVVEGERPTLDQIRRELGDCQRCKLCTGRKNIVFGVGNPRAELVFVGEGPGEQEDLKGVPFVGPAGELLTKMIQAMGFSRDDVYICNVVKCRPPGNRNPEPDEITACEPFLRSQLLALQPKVIVALGKFAAQTLLRDSTPITRLRGQWREYQGVKLMPTFHPAYLLRSPQEKKKAWEDLQQVMKIFGRQPGSRS
ncbi:uracil-DNA glycosylase [Hyalangium sp.]|uniref:uracil-DNA glycosylase n=1 Tax=Hyalangium sp. TaxID=2028555 RepID=UPI002D67C3B0|nr:uracil-DNA glycosylase [Hyalangium sp.]HYH99939.1 uracil-DNA glycosylase [Hyalangium sp.]